MYDNKKQHCLFCLWYCHQSSKRKTKQNVSPLLNGEGKQMTKDMEKVVVLNAPFPQVFVDKVCP